MRQSLYDGVDDVCEDEAEAGMFKAALFGDRSDVDDDTYESFQICGIAHVLSVGGMHLTILAELVRKMIERLSGSLLCLVRYLKKRARASKAREFHKAEYARYEIHHGGTYTYFNRANVARIISAVVADIFLLLFVIMIDGSVSAWRAYIMYTLMLLAPFFGRTYDILSGLGLAGILILVSEPLYALDSSFQFTFAALFGVGVLFPRLRLIAEELRPREENGRKKDLGFFYYNIVTPFIFSLSIQLMTIPVMLSSFYAISLYGIFLNLIIIPLMSLVMASIFLGAGAAALGGAGAVAGASAVSVGRFFAGVAHYFFKALVIVCDFVEKLPGASLVLGKPATWKIVLYYMVLAVIMIIIGRPVDEFVRNRLDKIKPSILRGRGPNIEYELPVRRISKRFLAVILIVPALVIFAPFKNGLFCANELTIAALYVGQGDCTVITLPNGHAVIFDIGSSSKKKVAKNVVIPYLKSSGITEVDMIFLSHPDIDHINGVAEVIENPQVSVAGVAAAAGVSGSGGGASAGFEEIEAAAAAAAVPFYYVSAGDQFTFANGTVGATVVAPRPSTTSSTSTSTTKNDSSLVVRLSFILTDSSALSTSDSDVLATSDSSTENSQGEFSALFTGDISSEEEASIIKSGANLSAIYLKCPHHGSKYSSSEAFLSSVHPLITAVSAGRGNTYGHPTKAALDRIAASGSAIYSTKTQGAILTTVTSSGDITVTHRR